MKRIGSKRINDIIIKLLSTRTLQFYAEFLLSLNQFEDNERIPTMAVNVTRNGCNLYYNTEFIDKLTDGELTFVLIHECFHLLFDHQRRGIHYNKNFSNIIMDMIINTIIMTDVVRSKHLSGVRSSFVTQVYDHSEFLPTGEKNPTFNKPWLLAIPKQYSDEDVFENLYAYSKDEYSEFKKRVSKLNIDIENIKLVDENNEPIDVFGEFGYGMFGRYDVECPSLDYIFSQMLKNPSLSDLLMDVHLEDEVDADTKSAKIKEIIEKLKNRGLCTSDVEQTLGKLRKKKRDHLKEIKKHISSSIMGSKKLKNINRPNRFDIEGLKGNKKYATKINCILDTSGSMNDCFDNVLSYIFNNDITINLIQIDCEIKSIETIKNKTQLQKLKIKGLGGTTLQPAIEHISQTKLNIFNTVILTDGYTDTLDFSNIKGKVLIVTTGETPPIKNGGRSVKIIRVEK